MKTLQDIKNALHTPEDETLSSNSFIIFAADNTQEHEVLIKLKELVKQELLAEMSYMIKKIDIHYSL